MVRTEAMIFFAALYLAAALCFAELYFAMGIG
jgi:hypothetical protein